MGSGILLVTIISSTPRLAVMPSSRTMSISISMMTRKPSVTSSASARRAWNSLRKASCAGIQLFAALEDVDLPCIVICNGMRDADGENQEGYQWMG